VIGVVLLVIVSVFCVLACVFGVIAVSWYVGDFACVFVVFCEVLCDLSESLLFARNLNCLVVVLTGGGDGMETEDGGEEKTIVGSGGEVVEEEAGEEVDEEGAATHK